MARKKLRQEIWRVRRTLAEGGADEGLLDVSQDWIGFTDDPAVWVDTEQFELALRASDGPGRTDSRRLAFLERAYSLYTGPLLDGEYDAWCLVEQDRFRAMHHEVAEQLVFWYALRGQWGRALRCARDILRYDAVVEHAHRQVMALLYLSGDRPGALRQFATCRQILTNELDVEPMQATLDLARAIREEDRAALLEVFGTSSEPTSIAEAIEPRTGRSADGLELLRQAAARMQRAGAALDRGIEALSKEKRGRALRGADARIRNRSKVSKPGS